MSTILVRTFFVTVGWLTRSIWVASLVVLCFALSVAFIATLDYFVDLVWFGLRPSEEYLFAASAETLWIIFFIAPVFSLLTAYCCHQINSLSQRVRSRLRHADAKLFISQMLAGEPQPFILYLRPFLIERRNTGWRRIFTVLEAFGNGFETVMMRAAKPKLVLKLGLSESSAAEVSSLTLSEDDWWQHFLDLAKAADKIVIIPLAQDGTVRELTHICSEPALLEKCLMLMPPNASIRTGIFDLDPNAKNIADAWNKSVSFMRERFGLTLPNHIHTGALLRRVKRDRFNALPFLGNRSWTHPKVIGKALRGEPIYSLETCIADYVSRVLIVTSIVAFLPILDASQNGEVFDLPTEHAAWGATFFGVVSILLRLHRIAPYRYVNVSACFFFVLTMVVTNSIYFHTFQKGPINENGWFAWVWWTWAPTILVTLPMAFAWLKESDGDTLTLSSAATEN